MILNFQPLSSYPLQKNQPFDMLKEMKNKSAQKLGRLSWTKRKSNKSPDEVKAMMSSIGKGKKLTKLDAVV